MSTRDEIRAQVFAPKEVKTKDLTFYGAKIELRQPRLEDILAVQQSDANLEEGQVSVAAISILLQYAYVPGTSEKVFEEGDRDALLKLPFDENMTQLTEALQELTDVNFTPKNATSGQDQTST